MPGISVLRDGAFRLDGSLLEQLMKIVEPSYLDPVPPLPLRHEDIHAHHEVFTKPRHFRITKEDSHAP